MLMQVLESDFSKPQNWKIFPYLANFKISQYICDKIWLEV